MRCIVYQRNDHWRIVEPVTYLPEDPQQSPNPELTQVTLVGDCMPHKPFLDVGALVTVDVSSHSVRKLSPNICRPTEAKAMGDSRAMTQYSEPGLNPKQSAPTKGFMLNISGRVMLYIVINVKHVVQMSVDTDSLHSIPISLWVTRGIKMSLSAMRGPH